LQLLSVLAQRTLLLPRRVVLLRDPALYSVAAGLGTACSLVVTAPPTDATAAVACAAAAAATVSRVNRLLRRQAASHSAVECLNSRCAILATSATTSKSC